MKRLIFLLLVIVLLVGCTQNSETSSQTDSSVPQTISEVIENSSDSFPESWIGKWVCVKSEWESFAWEGVEFEFYDYKNKIAKRWDNGDGYINTVNLWSKYDKNSQKLLIYFKESLEGNPNHEFEVIKQTETQIVLYVPQYGNEVVLEKK